MLKIAHLIHPAIVSPDSDLVIAQPITFESMIRAKKYARENNTLGIKLLTTKYADEKDITPDLFTNTKDLDKSIYDLREFKYPTKKLALLEDLLDRISSYDADFFIYTNVDISLMPYFYNVIATFIRQGYDAIAINRRTLSSKYTTPNKLTEMYSEIGEPHDGIDCFVFSKFVYEKYNFYNSFIGSGPVGLCFIANMVSFCKKFIWLEESHLTFHIGDDKSWMNPMYADYEIANFEELLKICKTNLQKIKDEPYKIALLKEIIEYSNQRIANIESNGVIQITANPKQILRLYSREDYKSIDTYLDSKTNTDVVSKIPKISDLRNESSDYSFITKFFNSFNFFRDKHK